MSDFFASVGEFFEQIGRDIHAQYDATRRSYNRANAEDKREKSARATGIVTERDAGLKTLPEYVYTLGDRARVIDAGSNAIERVEDRLGSLTRAKTLKLDANALRFIPNSLTLMTSLKVLNLRGNEIRSLPEDIGALVELEDLDVSENKLEGLPKSLGALAKLRRARFGANALTNDSGLDALGNCVELESVSIRDNTRLAGSLPVSWGCLIKLKEIDADGTCLSTVPKEIFLACENLSTLSMRRCPIDVAKLKRTEGYEMYETKRKLKHDKQIDSRVLMNESRFDERLG